LEIGMGGPAGMKDKDGPLPGVTRIKLDLFAGKKRLHTLGFNTLLEDGFQRFKFLLVRYLAGQDELGASLFVDLQPVGMVYDLLIFFYPLILSAGEQGGEHQAHQACRNQSHVSFKKLYPVISGDIYGNGCNQVHNSDRCECNGSCYC
jgi:hypothetical protein